MADYERAGVRSQGEALSAVERFLGPTLSLPQNARVASRFGQYASVLTLSDDLALAISTDGVGSKTLIASALDRYDSIGFDCMAMNVNDVICVGATPIAMVDYLGVHTLDDRRTEEILRGLGAAAKEAGVAVPGGEIAQLPEVIGSDGKGPGDERAFDLVGTCVGTVHPDEVVFGQDVRPGDALIGIASSGIHSNGLTLARRALLREARLTLDREVAELGCSLGEELLRPTEIYVRAITSLWSDGFETHGLAHITSDGFANLCRLQAEVGFSIESLPPPPPIFELIQKAGRVDDAEMYRVFNMGIGFVVIVPDERAETARARIEAAGYEAYVIGSVSSQEGVVQIAPARLTGGMSGGVSYFRKT